ncbi:YcnI family copper-binding membrane protein [Roseobacteraceae bacterium NS-SX3]
MKLIKCVSAALVAASLATAAQAHATLEQKEAKAGAYYKAVVRISHGCNGEATQKMRVQIPEGVLSVKPMPKPGWTLETVSGDYARTYQLHGKELASGVKEVVWTGDLADGHFDEFIFMAKLDGSLPAGEMLYFPSVQECASGENAWVEIPAAGQDPHALERPAPGLQLTAPAAHSH